MHRSFDSLRMTNVWASQLTARLNAVLHPVHSFSKSAPIIGLTTLPENLDDLVWGDYLKLLIGAVFRLLVRPPPAELCGVTEAVTLHVVIRDLHDQLWTQGLPREVLPGTPAALATGHATDSLLGIGSMLSPRLP